MSSLINRLPKPVLFALCAAFGCLIAALMGELLWAVGLPSLSNPQVDVVFALDVTGSMDQEIEGVKTGIGEFVSQLNSRDLDSRVGLVAFGDRLNDEEPQILSFGTEPFTADTREFSRQVGAINRVHGGDDPESSMDALVLAARQPFRPQATKVILLITDALPKLPDREISSIDEAVKILQDREIDQLHLVIQDSDRSGFIDLQAGAPGEIFSLAETAAQRQGFDRILPEVGKQIAAAVGTQKVSEQNYLALILLTSLWTSLLAIGAFLALIMSQNRYLRRRLLTLKQGLSGTVGSAVAGLVAGGAGQWLYGAVPSLAGFGAIDRILAWALLGSLLGWGMAFFIPNLKPDRAALGGTVGGALGAIAFLWAAETFGDLAGRLLGAAILGFFIGLAIALIEELIREAWLVVHWGPKEESIVSLGSQPVILGSSQDAHIYLPKAQGFPPVAATVRFTRGAIEFENKMNGQQQILKSGSQLQIGSLTIEVRAS